MGQQIQKKLEKPDYQKIYYDMIQRKYPEKFSFCSHLLKKTMLSFFDILEINKIISGHQKRKTEVFNQRHRSYNKQAICEILHYQKKNDLNDSQLARHFKMSRNTIAKWKKLFIP